MKHFTNHLQVYPERAKKLDVIPFINPSTYVLKVSNARTAVRGSGAFKSGQQKKALMLLSLLRNIERNKQKAPNKQRVCKQLAKNYYKNPSQKNQACAEFMEVFNILLRRQIVHKV